MSQSASDYNDFDGIALEAGGEVFIVNRNRLMQDSVAFRDMFEVAGRNPASEQGSASETPIPTGDAAAAFRDFLWALRVRPPALLAFTKSENTPEKALRLINVASLSHKYQDHSLADWALDQLHETLSASTFALEEPVLNSLLDALAHFESSDVKVSALTLLLRGRIGAASRGVSSNSLDLIALIQACTTSGFTALLSTAYNALLIAPGPQSLQWIDDPRISTTNKKQLLYGTYRLTEEWDRVLSSCPSQISKRVTQCGSARSADLLAKLNAARAVTTEGFRTHTNTTYYSTSASSYYDSSHSSSVISSAVYTEISAWGQEVQKLITNFPDKLATYFDLSDSGL